jgi:AraC-like DNA-binding protein
MTNPQLKIEAIALSAGFADIAAFSKAFKRRSGRTPTEYRKWREETVPAAKEAVSDRGERRRPATPPPSR